MNTDQQRKVEKLESILLEMGSVAIAFSGGVDSSFLLFMASNVLKDKAIGITVKSPYIPDWEYKEAKLFAKNHNIRHVLVDASIPESIQNNPVDRCYLCKKQIFTTLLEITQKEGLNFLAEGTNVDDMSDYRPGLRALEELLVRSPLKESGFTKQDIRDVSKAMNIPTWDKPAYACLLTRIPYNTKLDIAILKRIELAEKFLIDEGFRDVRVRDHGVVARIETGIANFEKMLSDQMRQKINLQLKDYGYQYVTIDIAGYNMGSFKPDK